MFRRSFLDMVALAPFVRRLRITPKSQDPQGSVQRRSARQGLVKKAYPLVCPNGKPLSLWWLATESMKPERWFFGDFTEHCSCLFAAYPYPHDPRCCSWERGHAFGSVLHQWVYSIDEGYFSKDGFDRHMAEKPDLPSGRSPVYKQMLKDYLFPPNCSEALEEGTRLLGPFPLVCPNGRPLTLLQTTDNCWALGDFDESCSVITHCGNHKYDVSGGSVRERVLGRILDKWMDSNSKGYFSAEGYRRHMQLALPSPRVKR
jgi:hypothetical protein